MRFVIADDSRIPRDYVAGILKTLGHDVVAQAENGEQALALCRRYKPDAVILDISMPKMTGDQVARAVVDEGLATHVIIASSMAMDSIFGPLKALGCKTLAKPYRRERLEKLLSEVL
jgi:YesN/AraC family two-component response regulator